MLAHKFVRTIHFPPTFWSGWTGPGSIMFRSHPGIVTQIPLLFQIHTSFRGSWTSKDNMIINLIYIYNDAIASQLQSAGPWGNRICQEQEVVKKTTSRWRWGPPCNDPRIGGLVFSNETCFQINNGFSEWFMGWWVGWLIDWLLVVECCWWWCWWWRRR